MGWPISERAIYLAHKRHPRLVDFEKRTGKYCYKAALNPAEWKGENIPVR